MIIKTKILILGDGQLAFMLKESMSNNLNLYIESISIDKLTQYFDKNILKKYLSTFNFITYETENISINIIKFIHENIKVYPHYEILRISQDRLLEKTLFNTLNIKTNKFISILTKEDLIKASQELKFPFILKTRRLGYDGKGQYKIDNLTNINLVWNNICNNKIKFIAEEFINFDYEISQIACRDKYDNIFYYPIVINKHKNGILRETHICKINKNLITQARKYITLIMLKFKYLGIFTVEFFVKNNILYANETAPRVHNSGHWSINGSNISQFKNHILAISENKIEVPILEYKYILMINIIGEKVPNIKLCNNIYIQDYSKILIKNRKMGHINIFDNSFKEFKKSYNIIYNNIISEKFSELNKMNYLNL